MPLQRASAVCRVRARVLFTRAPEYANGLVFCLLIFSENGRAREVINNKFFTSKENLNHMFCAHFKESLDNECSL